VGRGVDRGEGRGEGKSLDGSRVYPRVNLTMCEINGLQSINELN